MSLTFYATNNFTGDGNTTQWNINFADGYISPSDVRARYVDSTGEFVDIAVTSVNANVVTITPPQPDGRVFQIYRDTRKDSPLVDFSDGAILNETSLDTLATQAIMVAAESSDLANSLSVVAYDALYTAIDAATDATTAEQAAVSAQTSATLAQSAAADAQLSAAAAQTSAGNANTAANSAVSAANTATTTANAAATAAATAATKADAATATANSAATSASNALSSAASASTAANNATTTANNAATAAANAVTTANAAQSTANGIDAKATTALSTANAAATTANNASSAAGTATTTANNALSVAQGIDSKATTALSNANTAVTTANTAKSTADGLAASISSANTKADNAIATANAAAGDASAALSTANAASAGLDSKANITDVLNKANNLSDVPNKATARTNLGVGAVSTEDVVPVSKGGTGKTNVSDALDVLLSGTFLPLTRGGTGSGTAAGARSNLGLGDSATKNVGTVAGTVAAGDDSRIVNAAQRSGFGITGVIEFLNNSTSGAPGEGLILRAAHGMSGSGDFTNNVWQAFTPDGSYSRMQHYTTTTHTIRMVIVGATGGTGVFTFSQTGNAIASGSWVNSGSDERIKSDIRPVENPRDILMNVRAATWKYRHKGAEGRFGIGVIANDIGKYFPNAVINTGPRELDDGTVIDDVLAVEAGDSGAMVAVHHAVLQSLVEENASQQLQIDALSSELDDLKALVQQLLAERGQS